MINSHRKSVRHSIGRQGRMQHGVTSIEYALIASLIAIAIVSALAATGGANGSIWDWWTGEVLKVLAPP